MPDLVTDARALLALGALLLLPGLTVVRAPWQAVPFLSLSFWVVTWWWLGPLGTPRRRFVADALLFFAALAALRLLKPLRLARPGWPALLVAAVAAGQLVPLAWLWLPVGEEGPLRALTVRLLVWRDGLPRTYEPLAPVHSFGAALEGTDLLAADVALLAGLAPARAALLAALTAHALVIVALDALLARVLGGTAPRAGAAAARTAAAAVTLLTAGCGAALSVLAPAAWPWSGLGLASCVAALAFLWRGRERAPAVAAGLFLGAALAAEPRVAALTLPLPMLLALLRLARAPDEDRRAEVVRLGLAAAVAGLLAAPALLALDVPLSAGERAAGAVLVFGGPHVHVLSGCGAALLVALGLSWAAVRLTWPLPARLAAAAAWAVLGTAGAAVTLQPRTPPDAADRAYFTELAAHTAVTERVCIDASGSEVWLPALAGRGVQPAPLPAFYADEAAAGFARGACRARPGPSWQHVEKP